MPEIEIKIKVNMCSRCYHLWERRRGIGNGDSQPMVCPSCNSPYWDQERKRGKLKTQKSSPLMFHGEEVIQVK